MDEVKKHHRHILTKYRCLTQRPLSHNRYLKNTCMKEMNTDSEM